jgi:hypothetical protein
MEDLRDLLDEYDELCEQSAEEQDVDRYESLLALFGNFGGVEEARGQAEDDSALIPEDDFEGYARQLAEDIGAISDSNAWPLTCIDWEQAASDLSMDYMAIVWEGTTYFVRSM